MREDSTSQVSNIFHIVLQHLVRFGFWECTRMARRCITDLDLHLLLLEDFALHQTASASGRASLRLVVL